MIALIDYGAGNLFSVKNALDYLEADVIVTNKKEDLLAADGLILPGVGAFAQAMENLEASGLINTILQCTKEKPFLGICLGMQMLFEKSYEFGETDGLGLLKGTITKIERDNLKVPHMGWNILIENKKSPLIEGIEENPYVYFVHSFQANPLDEDVIYYTDYGGKIPALVGNGNVFGAQFHPEKSADPGLKMLENFVNLCRKRV